MQFLIIESVLRARKRVWYCLGSIFGQQQVVRQIALHTGMHSRKAVPGTDLCLRLTSDNLLPSDVISPREDIKLFLIAR